MNYRERKAERVKFYEENMRGWKLRTCSACNGSGRYDTLNSPKCAACNGTGKERHKPSNAGINARDEAVPEDEMPAGSEHHRASEEAKFKALQQEIDNVRPAPQTRSI